jgi:hypothetical protein
MSLEFDSIGACLPDRIDEGVSHPKAAIMCLGDFTDNQRRIPRPNIPATYADHGTTIDHG